MRLPPYTWTVSATLAVVIALVLAFRPQPLSVELATVWRGTFEQGIEKDGKTRVRQRYTVSAPIAGMLQRLPLKAGDVVQQGMLVATIAPQAPALLDVRTERELTERLGAAEASQLRAAAEVARAQATLEQARTDLQRAQQLAARGLMAQGQLEQSALAATTASRALEVAQQAAHAATHEVEVARAALWYRQHETATRPTSQPLWQVHAPAQGRVLKVWQESAGVVAAGTPLLDIADPTDLEVVVDVLTTDAVQIPPGASVQMEQAGLAQPLLGRVRLVEPGGFTKISALGVEEQRANVVLDFVSPPALWQTLGDTYRVETRILVWRQEHALLVPTGALFRVGADWAVFVVAQGRTRQHPVMLGRRNATEAVVEQGLAEGEQVILYPSDAVHDGVRVRAR